MKVIDLYNKIANSKDDEDYKKIKFIFNGYTYTWNEYKCDYDCENTAHLKTGILGYLSIDKDQLNREIEIIEEDKKIEEINKLSNKIDIAIEYINYMFDKANENDIIDDLLKIEKILKGSEE